MQEASHNLNPFTNPSDSYLVIFPSAPVILNYLLILHMLIFCVFSWREPSPLESLYNLHLSFKTQIEDFLWYLTWAPWHLWKNRLLLLLCIYFFYDLMSFFLSFNNISLYEIVILKRSGAMSYLPLAPQCIAQCLAHRKCLINVKRTDDWINGHVRKFSGWENGNEQNFNVKAVSQWQPIEVYSTPCV